MTNSNLNAAKKAKNDEFYTQLSDIENELKHYRPFFKGKKVYCNCDGTESNFVRYFEDNFHDLELASLTASKYREGTHGLLYAYDGVTGQERPLLGNGSFSSPECIELLKESDVVVTNPPFSLFRDFMALMFKYEKKFLVIGSQNATTFKEIFPYIKENRLWLGCNSNKTLCFALPDYYERWNTIENGQKIGKVPAISWFTNIEHGKRNLPLDLYRKYTPEEYPKYDNYHAFEVSRTADIPVDEYIDIEIDPSELEGWKAVYGDDIEILEP